MYRILTIDSHGNFVVVQRAIRSAKAALGMARNGHQFKYQYGSNRSRCWVEKEVTLCVPKWSQN
jgi:hypothetical protein